VAASIQASLAPAPRRDREAARRGILPSGVLPRILAAGTAASRAPH